MGVYMDVYVGVRPVHFLCLDISMTIICRMYIKVLCNALPSFFKKYLQHGSNEFILVIFVVRLLSLVNACYCGIHYV